MDTLDTAIGNLIDGGKTDNEIVALVKDAITRLRRTAIETEVARATKHLDRLLSLYGDDDSSSDDIRALRTRIAFLTAPGGRVVLTRVSPALHRELSKDDRDAVLSIVGKPVTLANFHPRTWPYGNNEKAEIAFIDSHDVEHRVRVNPDLLVPA